MEVVLFVCFNGRINSMFICQWQQFSGEGIVDGAEKRGDMLGVIFEFVRRVGVDSVDGVSLRSVYG